MSSGQLSSVLRHIRKLIGLQLPGEQTDGQLLERFAVRHEEAAFAVLVERHGPMVLGLCRRLLRHEPDAEDAFQATFLVLARKAASIRRRDSVGGWIYQVAYHLAVKAKAELARRRQHERQAAVMASLKPTTELDRHELRALLDEELQRLPEKYRTPLVLCYLEGKTHEEAARELDCPAGSMSWRLARGRELLRKRLARRGVALAAGLAGTVLADNASAAVPAALAQSTVKAALLIAAGQTAAGAVSAPVAALAESMLRQMFLTKLKIAAIVLLTVGLVGTGAGVLTRLSGPGVAVAEIEHTPEDPLSSQPRPQNEPLHAKAAPLPEAPKPDRDDVPKEPLPPKMIARLGNVDLRHTDDVRAVAFSPDGKTLASGAGPNDQWIRLWDVATGKQQLHLPEKSVTALAFSPDGKILVSVSERDKAIRLWDPATGKEIRRLKDYQGVVFSLAFSTDSKKLALGGDEGTITLWDVATGKRIQQLYRRHAGAVLALAFSPDGKRLASGSGEDAKNRDRTLLLWDLEKDGKLIGSFRGHEHAVRALVFSPDGKKLASAGGDAAEKKSDNTIRLWDVATYKERLKLEGHEQPVQSLAFSADGKAILSASGDARVRIWDVAGGKGKELLLHADRAKEGPSLHAIAVSPNGKMAAAGGLGTAGPDSNAVYLWELGSGKLLHKFEGQPGAVQAVAVSPDGEVLAAACVNYTTLWDVRRCKELRRLFVSGHQVLAVAFSPDGKILATGSTDCLVRLWDVAKGEELRQLRGHRQEVTLLAFSPDGKSLLSSGRDRQMRLWEVAGGKELWHVSRPPGWVIAQSFSPDGNVLTTAHSDGVIHREKDLDRIVPKIEAFRNRPTAATFSSDGHLLAAVEDGAVHLWETATGLKLVKVAAGAAAQSLAFSPDGRALAVGCVDGTVRLCETATGQELFKLAGHDGFVLSVSFSANGKMLVSGSADTTVFLWDVAEALRSRLERPAKDLEPRELEFHWASLADNDAVVAHQALASLVAAREKAVGFLKESLRPPKETLEQRVRRYIAELDDDSYHVREKAVSELILLGSAAERALRMTLEEKPSLEVRRRIEVFILPALNVAKTRALAGEPLRQVRAVQVLERIGTQEARQILEEVAKGPASARSTEEARAALLRLVQ